VEEARHVLERLARIEALERAGAPPAELLLELCSLVHEAEIWAECEGGDAADEATARLRAALARDMINA
jgi:hypothetical protein